MKSKDYYRSYVKEHRERLNDAEKSRMDNSIYHKVISSNEYLRSGTIFIYVSYKKEVDTHNIIRTALAEGKTVCVPKIISLSEGMKAVKINSFHELKPSKHGILEPEFDLYNSLKIEDIDLVYTPGVAFDASGGRIGYGGGFYDRFFLNLKKDIPKIALAYSFQVFDAVPMDENDIYIDGVITDLS